MNAAAQELLNKLTRENDAADAVVTTTVMEEDQNEEADDSFFIEEEDEEYAVIQEEEEEEESQQQQQQQQHNSLEQLQIQLKQYRREQSIAGNRPAYMVFNNATLEQIVATLPKSMEQVSQIKGIGKKKLEWYGQDILDIVASYAITANNHEHDENKDSTQTWHKKGTRTPQRKTIPFDALTEEQQKCVEMALSNSHSFITGPAGCGKTFVLRYLVQQLRRQRRRVDSFEQGEYQLGDSLIESEGNNSVDTDTTDQQRTTTTTRVGVCAPTGVAAILVGGTTLHSFFGIGPTPPAIRATDHLERMVQRVQTNQEAVRRLNETDVLIIDECSMLDSGLLELVDQITRRVRCNGKHSDQPFGGMRLIFFGDFFQLPPVTSANPFHHNNDMDSHNGNNILKPFCFESKLWNDMGLNENMFELRQVIRQDHTSDFVKLLRKVRSGSVQKDDLDDLNAACVVNEDSRPLPNDGILPTRLYAHNKDVDKENEARLAELESELVTFMARDEWTERLPRGTPLSLKKSMEASLAAELPGQVPLKMGAQVMLTRNMNLEKQLVNGSRGVVIGFEEDEDERKGKNDDNALRDKPQRTLIPIVRFDCGVVTKVSRVESERLHPDAVAGIGTGRLVREQIPLKLAWALTIHKSQGATLSRALLDISSAFEYGQCYVALSRVQSMEGLWLLKPARLENIKVSPQVLNFYSKSQ